MYYISWYSHGDLIQCRATVSSHRGYSDLESKLVPLHEIEAIRIYIACCLRGLDRGLTQQYVLPINV